MHRERIVGWWRTGFGTYGSNVARPMNSERLSAPDALDQRSIFALGRFPNYACGVGVRHLQRVHRRSFCLFCRWIAEADSSGAHIPEVAAIETALRRVVVQDPGIGGVRVT